jgi:hypothetical protein
VLRPPKQAPSIWQIFFTDWLSNKRAFGDEHSKLNVAQEAKEAAKAYSELSEEQQSVSALLCFTTPRRGGENDISSPGA